MWNLKQKLSHSLCRFTCESIPKQEKSQKVEILHRKTVNHFVRWHISGVVETTWVFWGIQNLIWKVCQKFKKHKRTTPSKLFTSYPHSEWTERPVVCTVLEKCSILIQPDIVRVLVIESQAALLRREKKTPLNRFIFCKKIKKAWSAEEFFSDCKAYFIEFYKT